MPVGGVGHVKALRENIMGAQGPMARECEELEMPTTFGITETDGMILVSVVECCISLSNAELT